MTEAIELFNSVGYATAITVCLLYYIFKDAKENKQAIENNTLVLTKLLTLFEHTFNKEVDGHDGL